MKSVPKPVLTFSILGLLPLLLGVILSFFSFNFSTELIGFIIGISLIYAGLILSFLGGCLFAFEIKNMTNSSWQSLIFSFLPTLWAFSALSLPHFKASTLAVGFLVTYELDRKALKNKLAPPWWLKLRLPLTTAVILLLIILGFNV